MGESGLKVFTVPHLLFFFFFNSRKCPALLSQHVSFMNRAHGKNLSGADTGVCMHDLFTQAVREEESPHLPITQIIQLSHIFSCNLTLQVGKK